MVRPGDEVETEVALWLHEAREQAKAEQTVQEGQILAVEPHSLPGSSQAVPYPPRWEPVQPPNLGLESSRPRCRGVVSRTPRISSDEIGTSQLFSLRRCKSWL